MPTPSAILHNLLVDYHVRAKCGIVCEGPGSLLFCVLKWYNCVVMKMVVPKISDNFQRTEGCKMILPHHFYPTNGVRLSDSKQCPCKKEYDYE